MARYCSQLLFLFLVFVSLCLPGCGPGGPGARCSEAEQCESSMCYVGTAYCPSGSAVSNVCVERCVAGTTCFPDQYRLVVDGVCVCFPESACR